MYNFNLDINYDSCDFTYMVDNLICPLEIVSSDWLYYGSSKSDSVSFDLKTFLFSVLLWSFLPFYFAITFLTLFISCCRGSIFQVKDRNQLGRASTGQFKTTSLTGKKDNFCTWRQFKNFLIVSGNNRGNINISVLQASVAQ